MTTAALPSPRFRSESRRVLAGAFIGSLTAVGLTMYLFGVFQDAMVVAFGTSVAVFSWAPTIYISISGVLSPFVGRSLATHGRPGLSIRHVMMAGAIAIGMGLILLSRTESLALATLVFAVLVAPGSMFLGPLLGQAMVTNWFDSNRGRALGLVSAGTTVGGVLIPPLAAVLINALGWRDAMAILGLLALVLTLPIVTLAVTSNPEDVGELPDGVQARHAARPATQASPTGTRELLRIPAFWLTGMVFGLMFSAGTVTTIFTVPYATELGLPLVGGAAVISMRAGFAAMGKIVLGALSDRIGVRPVLFGVLAVQTTLTALIIQTRSPTLFMILGVGLGFVGGAALPLKAALVGIIFGRASFASVLGLLATVGVPFQLFMVPMAGWVYERAETYAAVFGFTIPAFVLAGLLLAFVRPDTESGIRTRA